LKAALIAGADRLPNVAAAGAVVDPHQGFGRIDLAAIANPPAGVALLLQQNHRVETGQSRRISLVVNGSGTPLRVAMAYSDYPGASLVNNLNLIVTGPDGTAFVGNQGSGPPTFDSTNNVEVVHVPQPAKGTWAVDVVGSNVPQGPQRYAVAIRGLVSWD
jgi:serine protease AprX